MLIYKIFRHDEWQALQEAGETAGSAIDQRDGYVHFSTAAQLPETSARHFAGASGLWLIAVAAEPLGAALAWEPSRGGDLFPHLYGALLRAAIVHADPLPLDHGVRVWPAWLHQPAAGGSDSARTPDAPAKP